MSEIYAGSIVAIADNGFSRTIEHCPARVIAASEFEAKGKLYEFACKQFPGHQINVVIVNPSIPPVDDPMQAGIIDRRRASSVNA